LITLGIILGSTRPGRVSEQVAPWVTSRTDLLPDVQAELLDLAAIGLPFLDEAEHPSTQNYAHERTRSWSRRVDALDAVLLVTPEYNSSFPAPLKNALDYLSAEWRRKPVGMVGYGMTSAGTRAVASLTPVVVALGMVPIGAVQLPLRERLRSGVLLPTDSDDQALDGLLSDLLEMTLLLRRSPTPVP
jgi:NAD(P)H-dependent FMN reductase